MFTKFLTGIFNSIPTYRTCQTLYISYHSVPVDRGCDISMLILYSPVVPNLYRFISCAEQKIFFFLNNVGNQCWSALTLTAGKIMATFYFFIFTHFGINVCHCFFYFIFVYLVSLCFYNREISLAVLLRQLAK